MDNVDDADRDLLDGFTQDAAADAYAEAQASAEADERAAEALRPLVFRSTLERLIAEQVLADEIVQALLGGDSEDGPDGIVWEVDTSRLERSWAARPLPWPSARPHERFLPRQRPVRSAPRPRAMSGRRSRRATRAGPSRSTDDASPSRSSRAVVGGVA